MGRVQWRRSSDLTLFCSLFSTIAGGNGIWVTFLLYNLMWLDDSRDNREMVKKTWGLIGIKDEKKETIEDNYEVSSLIVHDDQIINRNEEAGKDGKEQESKLRRPWRPPCFTIEMIGNLGQTHFNLLFVLTCIKWCRGQLK